MNDSDKSKSTVEDLHAAEAALRKLVENGEQDLIPALTKIQNAIKEKMRLSLVDLREAEKALRTLVEKREQELGQSPDHEELPKGNVLNTPLESVRRYTPPETIHGFAGYLDGIRLLDLFHSNEGADSQSITIRHYNAPYSDVSSRAWQIFTRWLFTCEKNEDIRIRREGQNEECIDVRGHTFDTQKLKEAFDCSFLKVGITVKELSRKSTLAPAKQRAERGAAAANVLWNNTEIFFVWIQEELSKQHPHISLRCDEKYNAYAEGFFPVVARISQELSLKTHQLRREHMPLVVATILQRAKVAEGSTATLSQHIEDFPIEEIIGKALLDAGIRKAITPSQRKRINNRLKSANTFLSEPLLTSTIETFVREDFPFDTEKDLTADFLKDEYAEQLATRGISNVNGIIGKIKSHIKEQAITFPCPEKTMSAFIRTVLDEEVRERTEGITLDSFERLMPHCTLLEYVHSEDTGRILEDIRRRTPAGERLTRAKLNTIVREIFFEMPEYVNIVRGGQAGVMGGKGQGGRVIRGTSAFS